MEWTGGGIGEVLAVDSSIQQWLDHPDVPGYAHLDQTIQFERGVLLLTHLSLMLEYKAVYVLMTGGFGVGAFVVEE